jgi:hypothetical protein
MYILLIDIQTTKGYHFEVPDGQQSEETEAIIVQLGFSLDNIDWISSKKHIDMEYLDATEAVENVKNMLAQHK